jgi:hypothetical protein
VVTANPRADELGQDGHDLRIVVDDQGAASVSVPCVEQFPSLRPRQGQRKLRFSPHIGTKFDGLDLAVRVCRSPLDSA